MFRKIKRVVASIVLACSVFSLTAFSSSSASAMGPAMIAIRVGGHVVRTQIARAAVGAWIRLAGNALDAYDEFIMNDVLNIRWR